MLFLCSYSEKFRNKPGMKWQLELSFNLKLRDQKYFLKQFDLNFENDLPLF
jgi:hypothetical protein